MEESINRAVEGTNYIVAGIWECVSACVLSRLSSLRPIGL